MQAANDNGRMAVARMSREDYQRHERAACAAQRKRLGARASFGAEWNGSAANDNIDWPLAKALLAEGNTELLKYAMAYRRVYEQAKSEALLGGKGVSLGDGMAVDRHTYVKPDGRIVYKHARQSTAAGVNIPPTVKVPPFVDDATDTNRNSVRVPKAWDGDKPVNDMIDAKAKLARVQAKLGHLCEPFEMACIDGATLQEVGNAAGINNRAGAMGAGRAIIHMALVTVRDTIGEVTRNDLAA